MLLVGIGVGIFDEAALERPFSLSPVPIAGEQPVQKVEN